MKDYERLALWWAVGATFLILLILSFGCTPAIPREPPLQVRQDLKADAVADDYCWQMLLQVEKPGECYK